MTEIHMSAKEYQEMLRQKKAPKHHNKKVYVYEDGFVSPDQKLTTHGAIIEKYDSTKEYSRSRELLLLKKAGKISDLKRQAVSTPIRDCKKTPKKYCSFSAGSIQVHTALITACLSA